MFSKLALLSVFIGLAAGRALDVWDPPVTFPTAQSVWAVGSVQNVTWDTSTKPAQVTNPIGMVVLARGDELIEVATLASGFPLTQGSQLVTVPDVPAGTDYAIVVFGDSGNSSPEFTIIA